MAYTLEEYQKLQKIIASGAKYAKYTDHEVEYRGMADLLALAARMEQQLGVTRRRGRRRTGVYDSGLNGPMHMPARAGSVTVVLPTPQYTERSITVFIKETPDPLIVIAVGGGKYIYAQYAPGDVTIKTKEDNPANEVAYLAGKLILWPVFVSDKPKSMIDYNSGTGKFSYGFEVDDYLTLTFKDLP